MKQLISAQELARKNNGNAAVHAAYRRRRQLRRLFGRKSKLPAKVLDDLDWQAAEREARPVRAIGFFLSGSLEDRGRRLDFAPGVNIVAGMSVAELQKTIRGLSAAERRVLGAVAARMKRRKSPAHRRHLTAAMRAMDAGKKFTWDEVKGTRAERRKASDG